MNIPDYFLGKPYHKVVSRGEQIKPNIFVSRNGDACAFVRPPRTTPAEKSARTPCEIHGDRLYTATPVTTNNCDHPDNSPPPRHYCGVCFRTEEEPENPQRSKKTKGGPKDNQKSPGAAMPAPPPCHCTSHSVGIATVPLTHSHHYPPTPNVYGMTCRQEHSHLCHSCHSPAPNPAMACPHLPIETPTEADPHVKCACKRPTPSHQAEARSRVCCCTDDAHSDSSFEYGLSDDSASESSTGAVVDNTAETGETECISCHHYQLVCCCRHGVLYGTR